MNETRQISEFNESIFQIQRLHYHWVSIAKYRENGQLLRAKWKLDSIEIELKYDAKLLDDKEDTKYTKKLKELEERFNTALKNRNLKEIYDLVREKESILREIQQESGKGTKYKALGEDDMD